MPTRPTFEPDKSSSNHYTNAFRSLEPLDSTPKLKTAQEESKIDFSITISAQPFQSILFVLYTNLTLKMVHEFFMQTIRSAQTGIYATYHDRAGQNCCPGELQHGMDNLKARARYSVGKGLQEEETDS